MQPDQSSGEAHRAAPQPSSSPSSPGRPMMSRNQTIPLLIAIVCILFGVTFVRQYMKSDTGAGARARSRRPDVKEVRLDFPRLEIEGHPEWEYHLAGHHDFWFQNTYPYPVEIGFEKKSCRCSKVEALPLLSSDADQYLRLLNVTASTMALESPATFLNTLGVMAVGPERDSKVRRRAWRMEAD